MNPMPAHPKTLAGILLVIALVAAVPAAAVTAYPGSEITLTGTSTGSDTVYLFVTGPNLPSAGGGLKTLLRPSKRGTRRVSRR